MNLANNIAWVFDKRERSPLIQKINIQVDYDNLFKSLSIICDDYLFDLSLQKKIKPSVRSDCPAESYDLGKRILILEEHAR